MSHDVYRDADEILHLSCWYMTTTPRRKHFAMRVGGLQLVANEVWATMAKQTLPASLKLSTIVCNQTRWTLQRLWQNESKIVIDHDTDIPDRPADTRFECDRQYWRDQIEGWLRGLTYRERAIIHMRYGLKDGWAYTLTDTGKVFDITRERIRQIESKAIKKLRRIAEPQIDNWIQP